MLTKWNKSQYGPEQSQITLRHKKIVSAFYQMHKTDTKNLSLVFGTIHSLCPGLYHQAENFPRLDRERTNKIGGDFKRKPQMLLINLEVIQ